MPYAANGQISTAPIPGGIQITDAQYLTALAGQIAGKIITIDGGFAVIDPPQPEPEPEPEPVDPLTLPMDRLTFWLAAAEVGVSKWSVRDRIAAMPEGQPRDEAIAWFEEAKVYRRYDPLLMQLALAEGITEEQLDALWVWALPQLLGTV